MTRYRTRPREVTAVQWFKHGDHPDVTRGIFLEMRHVWIEEKGGFDIVNPTDWIVTDATGHRIVKAGDFAEQIEEISDE